MKNYLFKWLFIIGLVLASVISLKVNALVYVKKENAICTLTEEYKVWEKLTNKEKKNTIMPIKCEEARKGMSVVGGLAGTAANVPAYTLISRYNLMDIDGNNYVTPVKSQNYNSGVDSKMCWAFAPNAVVETSYLLNGGTTLDLSEKHISYSASRVLEDNTINSFGYNNHTNINGVDSEGSFRMSGTYFAQRRGPVLESKLPFTTISSTKENTIELKPDYYVENIYYFSTDACGSADTIEAMKKIIYYYGAVASMMSGDINDLSNDKSSYYSASGINEHAMTIIGWDDNYPKENFATTASGTPHGDGAWIVKNTYPTIFNSDLGAGYHYTSYYDIHVCSELLYVDGVNEGNNFNLYTYDKLGYNGDGIISGDDFADTIYYKQIFSKKTDGTESLESINLWGNQGDHYEIYYSTVDDFEEATLIAEGIFNSTGYYTIDVEKKIIDLDDFYIYLKYISNDYVEDYDGYYFPAFVNSEEPDVLYHFDELDAGVSFYSLVNPTQWNDTIVNEKVQFYPNMYVFTTTGNFGLSAGTPVDGGTEVTPTRGYYYIPLSLNGINIHDVEVDILDEDDSNVTDNFTVTQYMDGFKITPKSGMVNVGDYVVVFSALGISDEQEITIYPDFVPVSNVTIDGHAEVNINGTLTLTAVITPQDATNKVVNWSSSNPEIATVNDNGVVTGLQIGVTTITAITTDGSNISATKTITVVDNLVLATGIVINGEEQVTEGNSIMLTATVSPSNATNKVVSWSSGNETIATINSDGLLTAIAPGKVTITATTTDGSNKHAIKTITVKQNIVLVNSVEINSLLDEVSVNGTLNLSVNVGPENATNKVVTWSSSNETIAIVNENGVVTGRKAGKVTISATTTDGSKLKHSIVITVIDIGKEEGQGTTPPADGVDNPGTGDSLIPLSLMLLVVVIISVVYMKKKGIIQNI